MDQILDSDSKSVVVIVSETEGGEEEGRFSVMAFLWCFLNRRRGRR